METGVQKRNIVVIFVCLTVLGFLICIASLGAVSVGPADPDFYYYYGERKMALTLSTEKLAVRFNEGLTIEERKAVVESEPALGLFSQREESPTFRLVLLPLLDGVTGEYVLQAIKRLNSRAEVEGAFPIFVFPHSEIVSTDEFIVKFGPDVSKAEIDAFNTLNGVEIEDKIEGIEHYILRVKDPKNMDTLKMANLYSESPITIFSVFNYIVRTKDAPAIPDDDYFPEQWCLHNTGQTGGTPDADIDAPEGWDISTGSPDIIIAVLDTGVDLAHEDLVNKLVPGYDAFDEDNDPSPGAHWSNAHGTACAGLAVADTNNVIGIAGVSWDCKLMPIRVDHADDFGWWSFPPESFIRGINWAVNNGADVLSCSVPELGVNPDPAVQDAIRHAKNNGREERGCVVVIAAHNYNRSLRFPAAYPEVIAVGATDHNDERWDLGCVGNNGCGSNFGPELDVVAPSGWGAQQEVIMWSTDISGGGGYNPGDLNQGDADGHYLKWMGGTSAATPEVAGLAGLILLVNADLTADEVQFIIESTAEDVDESGGRDDEYGWGRINVYAALIEAQQFPTDDTLVGWWKFDEGEGTIAYDSAGDNNGDLIGPPQWVDGKINGALDFDGDGDYVSLSPIGALVTDNVTISAWIKGDGIGPGSGYHPIVSTYHNEGSDHYGYLLYVKNDLPRFYLASGSGYYVEASELEIDNGWHHLAGTYEGHTLKIYVDGESVSYAPPIGLTGFYEEYNNTYIGYEDYIPGDPPVGAVYFDGKIDDVRIYNWALDANEVWELSYESDADFNGDDIVNFLDYALFANTWQSTSGEADYNDIFDLADNNSIDYNDLAVFCEDWLWQAGGAMMMGQSMGQGMSQSLGLTEDLFPSAPAEQAQPELTEADIEEIIKWLVELWLTDDELSKMISEDEWLRFIKSVGD